MSSVDPGELAPASDIGATSDADAAFLESLQTIDLIGQAKGVLMATRRVSATEALVALRWDALQDSVSLLQAATAVVFAAENRVVQRTDDRRQPGLHAVDTSTRAGGRWPWRR